ncbi:MAG: helix-turn-helix domain-containing protein [Rhodocyclaceae bacterium]
MLIVHPGHELQIDLKSGLASRRADECGRRVHTHSRLGRRERAVLSYLARRPNRIVSRQELQDAVFHDRANGTAALTHSIGQIRQLLTEVERSGKCLMTIYGEGYLFAPAKSGLQLVADVQAGDPS